ncbi:MAG: polyprenyl synthetase family protein [Magnetococcales bacterium]|nr:polyprenyl synthetase family protein [Magnetococcales bacterium]
MISTSSSVLERLQALIGPDLELTNELITRHLNAEVELIPTLGTHLISSGGKRLRPILLLIAAKMCGYRGQHHALLAAVVEFIHTATLLHDDVIDRSSTRRGQATANALWGDKAPILVGDFLFSRAFQLLVGHGDLHVLQIVADTCAIISEGEVLQLVISANLETTEEQYMRVVSSKTASLFSAAAQLGAVISRRPAAEEQGLARYGLLLGTAYQMVDDALDYATTREALGKSIGDDFQEGKITLPLIHAYQHGSDEERRFWRHNIEQNSNEGQQKTEGGLARAIELIRNRGSLDYAMGRARELAQQAQQALQPFPDSPEKESLLLLADFAVERSY